MKLLFFDDFKLGALNGNNVVDISDVVNSVPHSAPHNLISGLIERWDQYKGAIQQKVQAGGGMPVSQVRVRPPVPKPTNIVAMAVNYMENGTRAAPAPINAFHKSPSGIIGDGDTMILPDVPANIFDSEGEMALVIGKRAENVKAAEAFDYIFGYMNFIDGSARGLGPDSNTFYMMKSRATFAPLGPYLVTADELRDPQNLQLHLYINGQLKQDYSTSDMGHKIPECIEWITSVHPLEPGDVVALGTNHRGLSAFQDGDLVEIETEGLGRLHIHVRDDLKRTWGKETRLERAEKGLEGSAPQLTGKYAKRVE